MKTTLLVLILSLLPGLALAAGEHGHHEGNNSASIQQSTHGMGRPGQPAEVNRTIVVEMGDDMRFTPATIKVKVGETVRFFVKNAGKLNHELVLGNFAMLKEHADMMRDMPGMQHVEANMLNLKAGQKGGLVWHFDQAGTVDFACLIPGHMEAGMKGQVQVSQ
ncbi:cupredoxin family protein [Vibrio coralliilyticus]|uniref:cupredoxin domain-containing protein n=1 Tax=Vibrio TaxID=662 RepID=UPI000BAC162F|nr:MULTISPECIES: cupredoxin family protein [Vibrio]EGQ9230981.1 cupredoxin family protein [Vibrio alginolyticus]NOI76277.1 cupredoxin family protein [Vibrio coralliilyticus]PAW03749.1 copper-binding protein [Vibrio coralliilyticus]SNC56807.1 plastocyanin [Vibrio cholerae]